MGRHAGRNRATSGSGWKIYLKSGVGNGNRTRNRRSHSPVLCQLSYSHHRVDYSNCGSCCQRLAGHRTDAVGAQLEDLASEPVETFQEQDSMMSAPGFVLAWTAESLP